MRLAVYITGHGLGHLTRSMEVMRFIRSKAPKIELHIRAPYKKETVIGSLGFEPDSHTPVRMDIGMIQHDAISADMEATQQRLEYYFGQKGAGIVEEEADWLIDKEIDAAYLDIPPRPFDACRIADVPAFAMTNFSWDFIWSGLAEHWGGFSSFADRAREAYGSCRKLYRTKMNADLSAFPEVEDVPLVARLSDKDPAQVRKALGIDSKKPVVILSYGGVGMNGIKLPTSDLHRDFQFIVTEPMKNPGDPFLYISEAELCILGIRYCDLVHMADVVMSKPGYSTVSECVGNLTALVYTERLDHFAEYPIVVEYIKQQLPYAFLPSEDLYAGNWRSALVTAWEANDRFAFGEEAVNGAEVVAERLISELESL